MATTVPLAVRVDEGLADNLNKSWPPSRVLARHQRYANAIFCCLVAGFLALTITTIIKTVRKRNDPPTSFTRDAEKTSFQMPFFTVCRPYVYASNSSVTTTCYDATQDSGNGAPACVGLEGATVSRKIITTPSGDWCLVFGLDGIELTTASPSLLIDMEVPAASGTTGASRVVSVYFTEDEPEDGVDFPDSVDRSYILLGYTVDVKLTRQKRKTLQASLGNLKVDWAYNVTYDSALAFLYENYGATDVTQLYTIHFWLRSSPLGFEYVSDVDPVDAFTLAGSIAGNFGYFFAVFAMIFGFSIGANMKELEEARIKAIVEEMAVLKGDLPQRRSSMNDAALCA